VERGANRKRQVGRSETLRPVLAGVRICGGREGSAEESVGFHPRGGATRAREPERVWVGPSPSGDERFQEPALWAADWVRRRRSKDFTRLALMPCARESDVDAPASLLQLQYDRSSSRQFQSLGYCANPHCCCSHRRPSLRRAVTASLLRKYVAAEFSGLLRRSPAQHGLAQTRILARASSRDHAAEVGRVIQSTPWT